MPPYNSHVRDIRPNDNASPADDLRSKQDIVWSCLVTLFACTWLAIHPNLPDPRRSKWSQFNRRIALMVLTIFAPEFILIWALRQRLGARSIVKEYNSIILETTATEGKGPNRFQDLRAWFRDLPPPSDRQEWTLAHGFYVQMGGLFVYEDEKNWPIRVLSFPELLDLIRSGLIDPPVISEEELCDKSKGDFFAKLFVVLQTTWFVIQCIVRWIAKLPLTELEIMAFSFAVLNVLTYLLWFEKPQNVSVGTRIYVKAQINHFSLNDKGMQIPETVEEEDITDSPRSVSYADPPKLPGAQALEEGDGIISFHDSRHHQPLPLPAQTESSRSLEGVKRVFVTLSILLQSFYLLGKGVLRAELFTQFRRVVFGSNPSTRARSVIATQTIRRGPSELRTTTVVSVAPGPLTVGTFFAYDPPGSSNGKARLIIFVVASGVLFGGLHLIPWKFTFPTDIESLLWRTSALYMILNPILLSFPLALYALLLNRSRARMNIRSTAIRWLRWMTPPVRIITIAIPLYILARLTIIVLALTTLRSLQPDVYKEIPWNSYIPHI